MKAIEFKNNKVATATELNDGQIQNELMSRVVDESIELMVKNPKEYYTSMKPACIKDVFDSNVGTLAQLKKEKGAESVLAVLVVILIDLATYFNIGKNMNNQQVISVANYILDEFYYLQIDDFKLCFDRAKKGDYGDIYGIDGSIIFKWLKAYDKERDSICEELAINSKPSAEINTEIYSHEFKKLERAFDAKNKTK